MPLPRVYFVDSAKTEKGLALLNNIKDSSFNPKNIVFTNVKVNVNPADTSVYAKIVEYKDELIKIDAKASGNNFMFLTAIHIYPTDGKQKLMEHLQKYIKRIITLWE